MEFGRLVERSGDSEGAKVVLRTDLVDLPQKRVLVPGRCAGFRRIRLRSRFRPALNGARLDDAPVVRSLLGGIDVERRSPAKAELGRSRAWGYAEVGPRPLQPAVVLGETVARMPARSRSRGTVTSSCETA
jgi:hypothetical protein